MTANQIITDIYKSKEIDEVIGKIQPEHIRDDLKQHVFVLLLEKDESFIQELHGNGKIRNYVVKVICQLVNFKQDKFHRQQRRCTEIPTDFTETETGTSLTFTRFKEDDHSTEVLCAKELDKVYWYNQQLLKLYIEHGSCRKVALAVGIPRQSVCKAIADAREQIKKAVQCQL